MKKISATALLILISLIGLGDAEGQQYTFRKGQVVNVSGKFCGLLQGKWQPVKKQGRRYVPDTSATKRCAKLLSPTALKKKGLGGLPSAAALLKSKKGGSARISEASGTPPLLKAIPDVQGGVKNVFWASGVVDRIGAGTPSGSDCNDFFVGATDGSSGGLLSCFSVQGVGYSFQNILEGSGGTCYMKNVSKQSLIDAGAVVVTDGSLPSGGIESVFSPPEGSQDRIVKVVISGFGGGAGETGFLRIDAAGKLASAGRQYGYTSWFCNNGQPTARNRERVTVSLSGAFEYSGVSSEGGSVFSNTIRAQLLQSGSSVTFDPAQERSSSSQGEISGGSSFKSSVTLTSENLIKTKVYDAFGGIARKNYSVARFSGSGLSSFRVIEMALKNADTFGQFQGGFEFRGDPTNRYVSAPSNALTSALSTVDLQTDEFYQQPANVDVDLSSLSCSAEADVTLQMNFSNPALQRVAQLCESERLEDMNFCFQDPSITQALLQYGPSCMAP
jgi:hypothetical protein